MDFVGNEVLAALCGGLVALAVPYLSGGVKLSRGKKKGSRLPRPALYVLAFVATGLGGLCVHGAKQAVQQGFTIILKRQTVPLHADENGVVQHKSAHYGQLGFGYPTPQYMEMVFDTGSGHVIVPSILCKSESCKKHRRYKRRPSLTGVDVDRNSDPEGVTPGQPRDMLSIAFGTGQVSGVFVKDYVCLGSQEEREPLLNNGTGPAGNRNGRHHANGGVQGANMLQRGGVSAGQAVVGEEILGDEEGTPLSAAERRAMERARHMADAKYALGEDGCTDVSFIYATDMTSDPFETLLFDGIVGLGLSSLSETQDFNFVDVLAQSGGWKSVPGQEYVFSVFFGFTDDEDSEITFGGIRSDRIADGEEVSHHAVVDPYLGYWQIKVDSISANGLKLPFCDDGTCRVIWDTGTSLVAVPSAVGQALVDNLRYSSSLPTCVEEDGPLLDFDIGGHTLSLSPADLHRPEFTLDLQYRTKTMGETVEEAEPETPLAPGALALPKSLPHYCVPMFMAIHLDDPLSNKTFIFGEPVMQKYYAVFNASPSAPTIGFALSKHSVQRQPREFKTE